MKRNTARERGLTVEQAHDFAISSAAALSWQPPRAEAPDLLASLGDAFELRIYDVIGWPFIEPVDVRDALAEAGGAPVTVRLNSPGGRVYDGYAIHNALNAYEGEMDIVVDGLAASIASLILMARSQRRIHENGVVFIHNAWGLVMGDGDQCISYGQGLNELSQTIAERYAKMSRLSVEEARELMRAETRFNADQAVRRGLCSELIKPRDNDDQEDEPAEQAALYDTNLPKARVDRMRRQVRVARAACA